MVEHCVPCCPTRAVPRAPAGPQPQGKRGTSACVAVTVSGGMKGLGRNKPQQHLRGPSTSCAWRRLSWLLTPHGILHFTPSWAQEGQREGLGRTGSCHWALTGLAERGARPGRIQHTRSCSLLSFPRPGGSREKRGLSFQGVRVRIPGGGWREGHQGSNSALNLSLPCSFLVGDSSQGDKRLPGIRREVRICCLRDTGGLAEKVKAAAGGARWSGSCGEEVLLGQAGGWSFALPLQLRSCISPCPRQELFSQHSPERWGPEQSLAPQPAFPGSLGTGPTLQSLSLTFGKAVGPGKSRTGHPYRDSLAAWP